MGRKQAATLIVAGQMFRQRCNLLTAVRPSHPTTFTYYHTNTIFFLSHVFSSSLSSNISPSPISYAGPLRIWLIVWKFDARQKQEKKQQRWECRQKKESRRRGVNKHMRHQTNANPLIFHSNWNIHMYCRAETFHQSFERWGTWGKGPRGGPGIPLQWVSTLKCQPDCGTTG